MLQQARAYFEGLSKTSSPEETVQWKDEVEQAEENRLHDLPAMDIYRTRSRSATSAENDPESTQTSCPTGPVRSWLTLALALESQQFIHAWYLLHIFTLIHP